MLERDQIAHDLAILRMQIEVKKHDGDNWQRDFVEDYKSLYNKIFKALEDSDVL